METIGQTITRMRIENDLAEIKVILRRQEELLQALLKTIRKKSDRQPARRSG